MNKFESIEGWLETKPTPEQIEKVLNFINRGQGSSLRKDLHKLEDKLRKLKGVLIPLNKVGFTIPKELTDEIELIQKEIDNLRPLVPVIKSSRKKGSKKTTEKTVQTN